MSVGRRYVFVSQVLERCDWLTIAQYGRVERVFIDRHDAKPKVFVKFTAELSALRVCIFPPLFLLLNPLLTTR